MPVSKMPFGKHKGQDIEALASSYLRWVAENVTDSPAVVEACEDELAYRDDRDAHFEDD